MWRAAARLAVGGKGAPYGAGFCERGGGEWGFTLLEMLVALSIMAVAALTLVKLDAFSLRSAGDLDDRSLAGVVAQNRAVEIWTDVGAPVIGTSSQQVENGGRMWRVDQMITRTADPQLLRIDLRVQPMNGAGQAALTIIRPAG